MERSQAKTNKILVLLLLFSKNAIILPYNFGHDNRDMTFAYRYIPTTFELLILEYMSTIACSQLCLSCDYMSSPIFLSTSLITS